MQFRSNSYLLSAWLCPRISSLFIAIAKLFIALLFPCASIQCSAVPLQLLSPFNPSLAIRRPTILCPCLSNQRFSAAFPIQSRLCYSDATLTGSPHFLCWPELFSSLLHHSSAQPFHTIPMLIKSFQRNTFPLAFPALRIFSIAALLQSTPFLSVSIRYSSNAQLLSALPMLVIAIQFLC